MTVCFFDFYCFSPVKVFISLITYFLTWFGVLLNRCFWCISWAVDLSSFHLLSRWTTGNLKRSNITECSFSKYKWNREHVSNQGTKSLTWDGNHVWKTNFFFFSISFQAMPLQSSSPGTGLSFRTLPVGDRRVQTLCMRKENVKMFPSVQCIGKNY